MSCDCSCSCFQNAPCTHCTEDHDNVDKHPVCDNCGEILYDATDMDILKHKIEEFELS